MAQGQATRAALSLRNTDDVQGAFREIKRWGDRLPIGATGFHVIQVANAQTINAGTSAKINFDTVVVKRDKERWKQGAGVAQSLYTVPPGLSGIYVIATDVFWGVPLDVLLTIQVNGVSVVQSSRVTGGATADRASLCYPQPLEDGDVISVLVNNLSGANLTIGLVSESAFAPNLPFLAAWRISLL